MADHDQAMLLRQWREHLGLSLENAAFGVELHAKQAGIDPKSKKIPRTHASLSRWETGKVEIKEIGLKLLAQAYGITSDQLREPPPKDNRPPPRQITVDDDDADMVEAFVEALRKKRAR